MPGPAAPSATLDVGAAPVVRRLTRLGIVLSLAMLVAGAAVLAGLRLDVRNDAERATANLVLALERDIARNVAVFDLSLQGAQEALSLPGIEDASPEIRQTALFDRAATAEYLGSILVLDPQGRIRMSSLPMTPVAAPLEFADRDYFQAQRDHPEAGLFVSAPYESRLRGGDASIAISRRLSAPDGGFAGVVMGALRLAYFANLFSRLDVGPRGMVLLARTDGVLLARMPALGNELGRNVGDSAAFRRMVAGRAGAFTDSALIDGVDRIYAYRRVGALPLVLAVGVATGDVYAEWWRKAVAIGTVLLVLSLGTAAMCLLFRREMARRLAAQLALLEAAERLRVMAATDSLTGLANRRAFEAELDAEWRRGTRGGGEMALILLDADHFKAYNDLYGHPAGDRVLERLADALRTHLNRPSDLAARIGGEEFVALLPETGLNGAAALAERIRKAVHDLAIPHAGSPFGRMTFSIGVAAMRPQPGNDPTRLLKHADDAMYRAKAAGRDRVIVATPDPSPAAASAASP